LPIIEKENKMGSQTIAPKHTQIYGPLPKGGIYGDKELGKMMDEFNLLIPSLKNRIPELKNADLTLRDKKLSIGNSKGAFQSFHKVIEAKEAKGLSPRLNSYSSVLVRAHITTGIFSDLKNAIIADDNNHTVENREMVSDYIRKGQEELGMLKSLLGSSLKK
jgi:hypothetical protein